MVDPRFKVGDRVRCLVPGVGTGTVEEIYRSRNGWCVAMKRDGTPENSYESWRSCGDGEDRFEPYPSLRLDAPKDLLQLMLDAVWHGQWETVHAAENTVCAYGCGEPYEDFVDHSPDCAFVGIWERCRPVRELLDDERSPKARAR